MVFQSVWPFRRSPTRNGSGAFWILIKEIALTVCDFYLLRLGDGEILFLGR